MLDHHDKNRKKNEAVETDFIRRAYRVARLKKLEGKKRSPSYRYKTTFLLRPHGKTRETKNAQDCVEVDEEQDHD